jgi:hypothetical protein
MKKEHSAQKKQADESISGEQGVDCQVELTHFFIEN